MCHFEGRMTPFMLEFLSDNQEGLGIIAEDTEWSATNLATQRGFSLTHKQLSCT